MNYDDAKEDKILRLVVDLSGFCEAFLAVETRPAYFQVGRRKYLEDHAS